MARYRSICALFFYDELNAVAIVISDQAYATFAVARAIVESAGGSKASIRTASSAAS